MRIYTRTGDDGTTGLYGAGRVSKVSVRIQALGDVDELNSAIGMARAFSDGSSLDADLAQIQNLLFDLGAEIGAPSDGRFRVEKITKAHVEWLEQSIDRMSDALPELREFILPGGSRLASALHVARTVCRRAERSVLALRRESPVRAETVALLNRLSDWLFTAARTGNLEQGVLDTVWRPSEDL